MSISEPETPFRSPAEERFRLYDGVETFVMFIGYKRSCHSLVAAILDAHPEIVISPGYQVIEKWEQYQSTKLKEKRMQKYRLFYDLHQHSLEHAMFLVRASSESCLVEDESKYNYHIPGLWQGGFQHRIKVNYRIATNNHLFFHALNTPYPPLNNDNNNNKMPVQTIGFGLLSKFYAMDTVLV